MGREDQKEEREVLDSIFPDEIQDISETEYRISISLEVINEDGDDIESPTVLLQVKYPEEYPEQAPVLELLAPPNAPAHPLFSVTSDRQELLNGLAKTIYDNLGMAMIFTLVSTLKENAEQLIASRQEQVRQEREQKILEAEREENKKFHGTSVTPETFMNWRASFKKEMEEARLREEEAEEAAEKKRSRGKEMTVQLTGKQLWERGMAGKVEEDYEEDDEIPIQEVEKLMIEA
ncbi:hypothetical protein OIDMADRAFT_53423 [Oidiodendron maius Zn]|uniref:RWD domain-containing protein n=1 Tax=Oidiodendron maius (strain Zn) TaxID=913774 RepID=A0A0C3DIS3_OIDMZ|nr:hypothetical protein OIDMADRAFT_53423 [Oidiodendron maius Zn]